MRKKYKIMHLVVGLDVGGTEKMLLRSLPLLNRKYNNLVVSITDIGPIGKLLRKKSVKVIALAVKPRSYFTAVWRFRKVALRNKPDLLITYLIYPDLFGRLFGRLFGIKKIICFQRGALLQAEPLRKIDYLTKWLVDHYLANSETLKKRLLKKLRLSTDQMTVVPNFVDPRLYKLKTNLVLQRQLDLKTENQVLTFVANLRVKKGHATLVRAFNQVVKRYPNSRLLLVGTGDQEQTLKALVEKLQLQSKVLFLGKRSDVPDILALTDVFVFPSEEEGMSNALMEALAAKRIIVCSNIEENLEVVGGAALPFKVKSVTSLRRMIEKALNLSPKQKQVLIRKGELQLQRFSLKNHFLLLDKVIIDVLS